MTEKEKLIREYVQRGYRPVVGGPPQPDKGFHLLEQTRPTELQCSCGERAPMEEVRHLYVPKSPPRHRKKRINKKWRKRWEKENAAKFLAASMLGLMRRPVYRCTKCGRNEGFYSAVGRNLIQVEPLPEGALPLYDKEPT